MSGTIPAFIESLRACSDPTKRRAADVIEELSANLAEGAKDAKRYRAIRGLITYILEEEDGIQGAAFSYQLPMALMESATDEELLDALADAAAALDESEAPK